MPGNIQILPSAKIDKIKWDSCVAASAEGLIYAYAEYLDRMCDNWSGLIIDDYKTIMPLPWRKKIGIRYIYQPAFIQQLGLIGGLLPDISSIYDFAKFGDILLNYENGKIAGNINAASKTNMVIDLSKGYDAIRSNYKSDLLLNLKKSEKESLKSLPEDNTDTAVKMYQLYYQQRMNLHNKDFENFSALARSFSGKEMCFIRKVEDVKGMILSIGLFLMDNKRIYNIMNTTTDEGRSKEANHFLLDAVIKEFAGKPLLFDFEGSDIPGIKKFYEKFGAVEQPYFFYHYNKLPAVIRLFKR